LYCNGRPTVRDDHWSISLDACLPIKKGDLGDNDAEKTTQSMGMVSVSAVDWQRDEANGR
jgi:hypothetical protein